MPAPLNLPASAWLKQWGQGSTLPGRRPPPPCSPTPLLPVWLSLQLSPPASSTALRQPGAGPLVTWAFSEAGAGTLVWVCGWEPADAKG